MFDHVKVAERAVVVQMSAAHVDAAHQLYEFEALARSSGAMIAAVVIGRRAVPDPKYFVGLGQAQDIKDLLSAHDAGLVLINHELSPSQSRNLERFLSARVVDRSGLILDIFAQRARTFEGKLQVELAQLEHLSSRLIRGWTHLERQKGGIGLRGPGETQLETDRRLIRNRILSIQKRLKKVRLSREQNRLARKKSDMKTVSLVGYTNAGKSTLFNHLTGGEVYCADQLFATLDPTMRKLELPGGNAVIMADTVGFIRDLPHHLIEAFKATLEETAVSDLLIHVIDISDPLWRDHAEAVMRVLHDIGAHGIPMIEVYNKIDLHPTCEQNVMVNENNSKVWLSAQSGEGLELLKAEMIRVLQGALREEDVVLGAEQGKVRAALYQAGAVVRESLDADGRWHIRIKLTSAQKEKIFKL